MMMKHTHAAQHHHSPRSMVTTHSAVARQTFELANDVVELNRNDALFGYDEEQQKAVRNEAPWKNDPNFFQRVRISSAALIKMVIHARAGGIYEVMGTMTGKVDVEARTIYIMDAFALPVEGTETRVNAGDEAYEFMVEWQESSKKVGRLANVVGWYHSHPGYRPWLSGIDVTTQATNQQYQDPFVAIVIDPFHTVSAGRVDIGAFRTYPDGYKPALAAGAGSDSQSIPLNKIEDFGVHADRYYALKVDIYKSSLDAQLFDMLWNKYWVSTLAQSPVVVNRHYAVGQLVDLAEKLTRSSAGVARRDGGAAGGPVSDGANGEGANGAGAQQTRAQRVAAELGKRERKAPLALVAHDSSKISQDAQCGLIGQVLKDALFNRAAIGASLSDASS